ncbi:hypothetical protein NEAUS07_1560 [Nematocida ausubeli]|nr:hypothetical protein NEAUS07_1560 [Nematocida ausubeli]
MDSKNNEQLHGEREEKDSTIEERLNNPNETRIKIYMDSVSIIGMLSGKKVLVVTPLTKDVHALENSLVESEENTVSVKRVLESINLLRTLDVCTVIINKYKIIEEMGLMSDLMEAIGEKRIIVALEGDSDDIEALREYQLLAKKLVRMEFFVSGKTILERMAMIFALTKSRPIKNVCIVVSHPKEERRVEVFLQSFGIKIELSPETKKEGVLAIFNTQKEIKKSLLEKYSLIVDMCGDVKTDKLEDVKVGILKIVTHGKLQNEDKRFKKIREQALKYKYRIESVIQLITSNVLRRKSDIEENIVKHLHGPLRLL